jgi:uncharacterized LabA/DUF88 family protein
MRTYAVLIDAGFLKRKLGTQRDPVTAERIAGFVEMLKQHGALSPHALHRVYYYDSPPLSDAVAVPLTEKERLNFAQTPLALHNAKLLYELARVPFFAIRRGDLVMRGWRIRKNRLKFDTKEQKITKDDIEPNVQQKGVDMRLGLDIASLTLKRIAQIIVLVAGDSDFVPAMKFARREGAQLFLVPLDHPVKGDLFEHADVVLDLDIRPLFAAREATAAAAATGAAVK